MQKTAIKKTKNNIALTIFVYIPHVQYLFLFSKENYSEELKNEI